MRNPLTQSGSAPLLRRWFPGVGQRERPGPLERVLCFPLAATGRSVQQPGVVRTYSRLAPWPFRLATALAVALANGCATSAYMGSPVGPVYHPTNVYRQAAKFPPQIRRVAVLPVSVEERDGQAEAGREQLQTVLFGELGKTKVFEAVFVSPEQLLRWTGAETWKADAQLPPSLFEHLQDNLGCGGVLFSHLRPYHAYRPLVIGWNFKLVDLKERSILWSADEVFDANEKDVARAAQHYYSTHSGGGPFLDDPSSILGSPRRFTQYTLGALLATLPER